MPRSPALQAFLVGATVSGLIIVYAVAEHIRQSDAFDEWRHTWRESVAARWAVLDAPARVVEENTVPDGEPVDD